jgi:glycosidase
MMLAALPGALYMWQGDTMGRPNVRMPEELQRDKDIGKRDGERVPMQWNDDKNGGFSEADKLWLPAVDAEVTQKDNLELQARDARSPYRLVQRSLWRRAKDEALRRGGIRMLHTDNPDVLAFARPDPDNTRRQIISVTNLSADTAEVSVLDAFQAEGVVELSATGMGEGGVIDFTKSLKLAPDESYLISSV